METVINQSPTAFKRLEFFQNLTNSKRIRWVETGQYQYHM